MKKLSIVTTLYHSAPYIEEFCLRASESARQMYDDFEIILVNDGSPDNSLEVAKLLLTSMPNLAIVDLSRNFGHHKAMMTGLAHATGELVFLIDSDLEEEPEWLLTFHSQMQQQECDVVYGVQEQRKGGLFERFSGEVFYRLFRRLSGLNLPSNVVTARLMTRRYVKSLLDHREREVYLAGLWHITGFDQQAMEVQKHDSSHSTYTFRRKMAIFVNSITSFSNTPLISIFYIGISILFLAGSYTTYLIYNWLFLSEPLLGWTSLMASIWLLGGLMISFTGVIGIYLSKIFIETKQRPYTIIRKVYEVPEKKPRHMDRHTENKELDNL
ncbi:MAG: glycosyltransferase family 2 protein [Endozoicomonas sp.]